MFKVNDYVVYGSAGVCRIETIGPMAIGAGDKDYYTLQPVYQKGSHIFTPVDNVKVVMRPILSKEESNQLIDEIEDIETIEITDEKAKDEIFKEKLKNCDCRECVSVIKTLYQRITKREEQGKKATSSDEKFLHQAQESLYGELAFSLNIAKNEVEQFITERIESIHA